MPYLVIAHDHENCGEIREKLRESHRDHLRSYGKKLLASGAILDEKKNVIGGMSILDVDEYLEAKKFCDNDPYSKHKIRKNIQIVKWRKRWWEGSFLGEE
jgi:uncharacterized protein YciI